MGPSRWWYVVAGVLAVAGTVVAAVLFVRPLLAYDERVDSLQRVPVPGSGTIELDEPGGYTVYFEGFDPNPSLNVTVTIDGVELRDYFGTATYSDDDREGVALQTFRVDEPGSYRVSAGGEAVGELAIGRSVTTGMFRDIALSVAVGGTAIVTAIVIGIVVAVKRATRAKRSAFPPARPGP